MIFKIGDTVKLLKTINTSLGTCFLKNTIGVVCDDDNPQYPYVELKESNGKDDFYCFDANDLELVERSAYRKIKLGDKVKTLIERTEETSHGPSTCPKGVVGYAIDDDHYPDFFIEIKNKDDEFETFGYGVDELELIK